MENSNGKCCENCEGFDSKGEEAWTYCQKNFKGCCHTPSTDTNERKMEMKPIEETGYAGLESTDTQETTTESMEERLSKLLKDIRFVDKTSFEEIPGEVQIRFFVEAEITRAIQEDREELREKIEELRRRFKCAKCDGAKTLEHTQCCQALNIIQQP